jgi:hypothetical protein
VRIVTRIPPRTAKHGTKTAAPYDGSGPVRVCGLCFFVVDNIRRVLRKFGGYAKNPGSLLRV